jgi:hypothetical protein
MGQVITSDEVEDFAINRAPWRSCWVLAMGVISTN